MERSFAVFDATKRKNKHAIFLHFHRVETSVEKGRDKKGRDNSVVARCVSPRRQERLGNKASSDPTSSRENDLRKQHSMQLRSPCPGSFVWRDKTRCRYHTHERPELCGAHHMKEERPYCPSMLSKPFIYTQTCAILLILPFLYRELCPKWGESRQA